MTGGPRTLQRLACATCGTPFEPGLVFEQQGQASCRRCGAILDLRQRPGPGAGVAGQPAALARQRPDVPMPRDVQVDEVPGGLVLTLPSHPTFGWWTVAPVALAAAAALALLAGLVSSSSAPALGPLVAALGLGGAYVAAAVFINRTRLTIANGELDWSSGPLPWPSALRVPAKDVRQVFCEEHPVPDEAGNVLGRTYGVSAVVGPEGRRILLVRGLPTAELALWLEQAMEHTLGIDDAPVGGAFEP